MNTPFRISIYIFCISTFFLSCNSTPKTGSQSEEKTVTDNQVNTSEYKDFSQKFDKHNLPYSLPAATEANLPELDKKYINDLLTGEFTPAFGKDDVLPKLAED